MANTPLVKWRVVLFETAYCHYYFFVSLLLFFRFYYFDFLSMFLVGSAFYIHPLTSRSTLNENLVFSRLIKVAP